MTDWRSIVVPELIELGPADAGGISEVKKRYGLDEVVKLHWNENLFGPLPGVLDAVRNELEDAWMYPEEAYEAFRSDVAGHIGTSASRVVAAHGTQSLIGMLASALLRPGDDVVVPALTYYLYGQYCAVRGARVHRVPMQGLAVDLDALAETAHRTGAKIVWVCDPNNPTGALLDDDGWEPFLDALPDGCIAVADEAYRDFLPIDRQPRRERGVEDRPVVVLRSFSKFFGLAGLRLGYAVVNEVLGTYLTVVEEEFNVNCAALAAGRACLRADAAAADERRREIDEGRDTLILGLGEAGLHPFASVTNFVLARVDVDDVALAEGLAERGILIRPGTDFGQPGYVRITVGPAPLMSRVTADVRDVGEELRR